MNVTNRMQVKVHGKGKPILLVPGGLTGWKSWEPFIQDFTARQKEVLLVQLLNVQYGLDNLALPDEYSVRMASEALAKTIDSLGYSVPIDIVAWSYGALVSLDYALEHPEKVASLTLIEPPAIWALRESGLEDNNVQEFIDFLKPFRDNITENMLESFLRLHGLIKEGQSTDEIPQWGTWVTHRQSLRNNRAILEQRDKLGRLEDFRPAVLLVKGIGSVPYLHQITDVLQIIYPMNVWSKCLEGMHPISFHETFFWRSWIDF